MRLQRLIIIETCMLTLWSPHANPYTCWQRMPDCLYAFQWGKCHAFRMLMNGEQRIPHHVSGHYSRHLVLIKERIEAVHTFL